MSAQVNLLSEKQDCRAHCVGRISRGGLGNAETCRHGRWRVCVKSDVWGGEWRYASRRERRKIDRLMETR